MSEGVTPGLLELEHASGNDKRCWELAPLAAAEIRRLVEGISQLVIDQVISASRGRELTGQSVLEQRASIRKAIDDTA